MAIEVKSNSATATAGLAKFKSSFNPHRAIIVGEGGIPAEEFMRMDLSWLFE